MLRFIVQVRYGHFAEYLKASTNSTISWKAPRMGEGDVLGLHGRSSPESNSSRE